MSHPSKHLSPEENQKLFSLLGSRKESISTAVVQLLFATNTRPSTWKVKVTGVVCFVKDPNRKGFFIEVSGLFYVQSFTYFIYNSLFNIYSINIHHLNIMTIYFTPGI